MSEKMNVIENLELNIAVDDASLPVASKSELYRFANNAFAHVLDDVLCKADVDGDMELDSLTLDLNVDADGDVFRQIADSLRSTFTSKLAYAAFKKRSQPVKDILADVYHLHLPLEKSCDIEERFDALAERWNQEHQGQKFDAMAFSESVIKVMQAENPNMDIQQIAYVVYQRLMHLKNEANAKKMPPVQNSQGSQNARFSAGPDAPATSTFEVSDSVLVLLSPYLPALFERTGCVEKGEFLTEEAKRKALAILKFVAFGTYGEPPRTAAVMNLLCGLPVSPLFRVDELPAVSDDEKQLVEGLLKAVIANWKAVGHMSPDGLRGSYFVRSGVVETAGAMDLLTVENKTFDILIERLPWTYSMIKHPWMKKTLNVKWR